MKNLIKYVAVVFCGLLILLFIGQEGYREKIDKLNIWIYFDLLFLFWLGHFYYIEKFKKSEEEVNKIFAKYLEIFLIIQLGIISIIFFYILGMIIFGFKEVNNNIHNIIYIIIFFGITYLWYYLTKIEIKRVEKKEKEEANKSENQELIFDSRENYKDGLKELILSNDNNSMILIDGEWGIGKTFFVNKAIEELKTEKKDMINTIEIDAMLFNSRKSLKDELFNGLSNILEKNEIIGKSVNDISEKMDSIIESENKFINIVLKFIKEKISIKNKTFSEDIEQMKKSIKKLENKKIVVVIDNLERLLKKEDVIEIMGFLHEIQSIEGITFIICADKDKLKKMIEDDKYIEKFFLQEIELKEVDTLEIIDKMGENYKEYRESLKKIFYEIFSEINEEYLSLKNKTDKLFVEIKKIKKDIESNKTLDNQQSKLAVIEQSEKIELMIKDYDEKSKIIDMIEKIKKKLIIPREIEKIYLKINNLSSFKNIYLQSICLENSIDDKRYKKILSRCAMFQIIFDVEYKEKIEKIVNYNWFKDYIPDSEEKLLSKILKSEREIEKRAYMRILEKGSKDDKNIIEFINNFNIKSINENNICEGFEKLSIYYRYFETMDNSIKVYEELMKKLKEIMENNKEIEYSEMNIPLKKEQYINLITDIKILELDKRYCTENNKKIKEESILSFINYYKFDIFWYEDNTDIINKTEKSKRIIFERNILEIYILELRIIKYNAKNFKINKIEEFLDIVIGNYQSKEKSKIELFKEKLIEKVESVYKSGEITIELKKDIENWIDKLSEYLELILARPKGNIVGKCMGGINNLEVEILNGKSYIEQKILLEKYKNWQDYFKRNFDKFEELEKQWEDVNKALRPEFQDLILNIKNDPEIRNEFKHKNSNK